MKIEKYQGGALLADLVTWAETSHRRHFSQFQ